ncbi:MAG: hypothetical protein WCI77_01795 [Candidatus Omnitrophota bacterium]
MSNWKLESGDFCAQEADKKGFVRYGTAGVAVATWTSKDKAPLSVHLSGYVTCPNCQAPASFEMDCETGFDRPGGPKVACSKCSSRVDLSVWARQNDGAPRLFVTAMVFSRASGSGSSLPVVTIDGVSDATKQHKQTPTVVVKAPLISGKDSVTAHEKVLRFVVTEAFEKPASAIINKIIETLDRPLSDREIQIITASLWVVYCRWGLLSDDIIKFDVIMKTVTRYPGAFTEFTGQGMDGTNWEREGQVADDAHQLLKENRLSEAAVALRRSSLLQVSKIIQYWQSPTNSFSTDEFLNLILFAGYRMATQSSSNAQQNKATNQVTNIVNEKVTKPGSNWWQFWKR